MEVAFTGRAPQRKAKTRAAIVEAAASLFCNQGYDATSIHQVAALADTGVGTLYNYFSSKEEILRAVLERQFEGAEAAFAQIAEARPDPVDRLRLALDMYGMYVRQNRRLLSSLFGVMLRGNTDLDGVWRHGLFVAFRDLVQEAVESGAIRPAPVEPLTRLLLSTYTFATLRMGVWRDVPCDDASLACELNSLTAALLANTSQANASLLHLSGK
jgi:AcrR family transcriptional regulator